MPLCWPSLGLAFLGWLAALVLAVAAVLGMLALIAFFGGGQDGPL